MILAKRKSNQRLILLEYLNSFRRNGLTWRAKGVSELEIKWEVGVRQKDCIDVLPET